MIRKSVLQAIICLLVLSSEMFAEEWSGIQPLKSTRADVERVLGKCKTGEKPSCYYEFENKGIFIRYASGKCADEADWNVPPDTVTNITIYYNAEKKPAFSDFAVDFTAFKVEESENTSNTVIYQNKSKGISFAVKKENVLAIFFYATETEKADAKCEQLNRFLGNGNP